MSGRVEKSSSDRRSILSARIESRGVVLDMPCSNCWKAKRLCKASPDATRCLECVKRGKRCDGKNVASARRLF